MKCPKCGSENLTSSHRRGIERIFKYLFLHTPYRCRMCWARFWKFRNPLKRPLLMIVPAIVIFLVASLIYKTLMDQKPLPAPDISITESKTGYEEDSDLTSAYDDRYDLPEVLPSEQPSEKSGVSPSLPGLIEPDPAKKDETDLITGINKDVVDSVKSEIAKKPDKTSTRLTRVPDGVAEKEIPGRKVSRSYLDKKQMMVDGKGSQRTLKTVQAGVSKEAFKLALTSDGPIETYRQFFLEGPPRIVLNLAGKWDYPGETRMKVDSDVVKSIRIGEHDTFLSIVIDLKSKDNFPARIEKSLQGLGLYIKRK
ncbi:AMIN domain-containing protein [Desulfobacterales bacterium HSG16]|nr:AMIN domain-containing protein [Desulfobacterales bacterium HSG16]